MNEEIHFSGELSKVSLLPSDVLVLKCKGRLSADQVAYLAGELAKRFPDNKVLVLDSAMELTVVAASEAAA